MLLPGTSPSISQAAQRFREKKMRIFRVRREVVDLIAIGASSCLVQEFLRRRQRRAKPGPHGPVAPGGGRLLWRALGTNRKKTRQK